MACFRAFWMITLEVHKLSVVENELAHLAQSLIADCIA
jgi:hypothetical protein